MKKSNIGRIPLVDAIIYISAFLLIIYIFWLQLIWSQSLVIYGTTIIILLCSMVKFNKIRLDLAWTLFILITSIFGLLVSDNATYSLDASMVVFKAFLFATCILNVMKLSAGFKVVRVACIIAGLCLSTMLMISGVLINGRVTLSDSMNGNVISTSILVALIMCLYESIFVPKRKILLFLICFYMFSAALLTGSRKSFVGMLLIIVFYFIFIESRRKKSATKKIVFIAIGFMVVALAIRYALENAVLLDRFLNTGYLGDQNRLNYYMNAVEIFSANPLLGKGWGGFAYKYGMYSHSTYAELIANTGLIGTLCFLGCIIRLFRGLRDQYGMAKPGKDRQIVILTIGSLILILGLGIGAAIFYEMNMMLCIGVIFSIAKPSRKYFNLEEAALTSIYFA